MTTATNTFADPATVTVESGESALDKVARIAPSLSLAAIFAWFGGMKFTGYEAEAINGLIANSPFIAWTLQIFSAQSISNLIGTVEIGIALLLLSRIFSPRLAEIGGYLAAATFALTFSFFLSTPGVFEPSVGGLGISVLPGQFLLKDIGLLALSLVAAREAHRATA
ncbi:YkgB family protein [Aurantiacibacter sp. D1-12]|uniref:YkgB family protein n=1 Tax=Aurantiacibacter sp. D1-12 TaxID=2993658 RepID=UPI00237C7C9F|nr:DUF417 family protein [Aurantiacibacter sp. D1-12]MDE1466983.1 DUF417 family protein [Aurantiacibacter sp. D1-12]